jgi:hypothetical protein
MEMKKEWKYIASKVSPKFHEMITKFLEEDSCFSVSNLIRTAIREKIEREAPWLLPKMVKKGETEERVQK